MHCLKISFTQGSWVLSFCLKGSKWLKLFRENALIEKNFWVLLVLLYNAFFAIVYKHFFYIKTTLLYWNWFFLNSVQGGEYSSTVKNQQKLSSVHHGVGIKELNLKYMSMKNIKIWNSACFFMTETDQFLAMYSYTVRSWELFKFFLFISGLKDLSMKYMYMKNRTKFNCACFLWPRLISF